MRLERFYVEQYRVLRELDIVFSRDDPAAEGLIPQQKYTLDFLAGVNGTGKSSLLHLLGKLFAHLQAKDYSDYFPVTIELVYVLKIGPNTEQRVTISNRVSEDNPEEKLGYKVDDENLKFEKIRDELLPSQIVIYTTGSEVEWLEELETGKSSFGAAIAGEVAEEMENDVYLHELPGHLVSIGDEEITGELEANKPLLFIQSERMAAVALCGLLASRQHQKTNKPEILASVLDSIGLEGLEGFSLKIRSNKASTPVPQQDIIDSLEKVADRIIRRGADHLLIFNTQNQLTNRANQKHSIFSIYGTPIELFQHINLLYEHRPYYDRPLQEVNLFLRRRLFVDPNVSTQSQLGSDRNMLQLFEWLSDGERSFLARMALFALFRSDNLLILLDEPEVHFNDVWKRKIVDTLDAIMQGCVSHALITTHSSIALTDVLPSNIMRLERTDIQTITANRPRLQTFGADPSDIMVHVFGAPQATGAHSVDIIRNLLDRANRGEVSRERLEKTLDGVAPGYWSYRIRREVMRMPQ